MKKLCLVATIPEVVHSFMRGHISSMPEEWKVSVVTHPANAGILQDLPVQQKGIAFRRKPSPLHDLPALLSLWLFFRREKFSLVHSIMPKTGLLAMLAARLAGIPVRVHTFTGQVWANRSGLSRLILKQIDKLIVGLATHVIVDSPSQRDFLEQQEVLPAGKGVVIGGGSICGVDIARFHVDADQRNKMRQALNIGEHQIAILYLGRMNLDKGIPGLVRAFADLVVAGLDAVLILVGPEENYPFSEAMAACKAFPERLRTFGFTHEPQQYMMSADIFCLPSFREGFGQVIIEAAACAVPSVASRIYGITDAVVEGETGLLYPAGNVAMLRNNLSALAADPQRRQKMGEAARQRVLECFSAVANQAAMMQAYRTMLNEDSVRLVN